MRTARALWIACGAMIIGCAGPDASPFPGRYQGTITTTTTLRSTGETMTAGPDATTVVIEEGTDGGLFLAGMCPFALRALSDRTFEMVPTECVVSTASGPITVTLVRGTGTLEEPNLTLNYVTSATSPSSSEVFDASATFAGVRVE